MSSCQFDILVVGAGHAGCEAALAAARMRAKTALLTMRADRVARMSCNPSVGGMAKSHIVCEVDALGGEIARNTDYTGIQFRTLNTRKGPAVQAHRVQCDKDAYSARMASVLAATPNLQLVEGIAAEVWVENGRLKGVALADGSRLAARAVILTTGTFLNGTIHIGLQNRPGGRFGEEAANQLSQSLRSLGFTLGRLKTGTPPRLHRDSIDYDRMEGQPGLQPPPFLSAEARRKWAEGVQGSGGGGPLFHVEQRGEEGRGGRVEWASGPDLLQTVARTMFYVEQSGAKPPLDPRPSTLIPWPPGSDQIPCFLTRTTAQTHAIIAANLQKSALYGGAITGTGVRYCPSIEDKIVKFPDKETHHIFIEPEGRQSDRIYPNGTSNSLPEEVQVEMIHSIPGLERAVFIRPGYGIEYDFSDPTQLFHTMESKLVEGLFLAGQINGTTGYEEAAGQGLVAGVNAVFKLRGEQPLVLSRSEAYLGVLIDDLVTKGTDEPYRMFTSRAEHRLLLRQGNARFRMLGHARRLGILPPQDLDLVERERDEIDREIQRLASLHDGNAPLAQVLRRPEVSYRDLPGARTDLSEDVVSEVEVNVKYEGYIRRDLDRIARGRRLEEQTIPVSFKYEEVRALRREAREKLVRIRPETLGQASRISGVNPSDIAILSVWLHRGGRRRE